MHLTRQPQAQTGQAVLLHLAKRWRLLNLGWRRWMHRNWKHLDGRWSTRMLISLLGLSHSRLLGC